MRIALTERFQEDVRRLAAPEKAKLMDVLLALPKALANPHVHAGLGLRKLHILVTHNRREFARVRDLKTEDWY